MFARVPRHFSIALILLLALAYPLLAQTSTPDVRLTVGGQSCSLALATAEVTTPKATSETTPEATPTASDLPTLTLSDDCAEVTPLLRVASNGVLWLSLTLADLPDQWLKLSAVAKDEHPPLLDQRGRYFGCTNPTRGEGVCRVQVEVADQVYRVEIPLLVSADYRAPSVTASTPSAPTDPSQPGAPETGSSPANPSAPTAVPTDSPPM